MLWHLIITPFLALFNLAMDSLPPWTITIGSGLGDGGIGAATDGNWIHYGLQLIAPFDRFFPLHDGVLPLVTIALAIFVGLSAFKAIKFFLSLIPTVSAGG